MTTDITELAQRLATCAKEDAYPCLSPDDCGALVEALEEAQRANGYLREQSDEWERKAISNFQECAKMSERIYLLESRTVTVKLPGWFVKDAIAVYDRDEVEEALNAAGIKVEAE
jgi:hypothetical protein